jgi:ubiquinone biosynthesis protein UbiJ
MIEGGYILGGTLLLCGAAIYRQRLTQAAQLAAIKPKSSLEKVIGDVSEKAQYAARETAQALLPVAHAVDDVKDFVGGLVGGPSIVDQIKAATARQKAADAEVAAAGGFVPWVGANIRAGLTATGGLVRKGSLV